MSASRFAVRRWILSLAMCVGMACAADQGDPSKSPDGGGGGDVVRPPMGGAGGAGGSSGEDGSYAGSGGSGNSGGSGGSGVLDSGGLDGSGGSGGSDADDSGGAGGAAGSGGSGGAAGSGGGAAGSGGTGGTGGSGGAGGAGGTGVVDSGPVGDAASCLNNISAACSCASMVQNASDAPYCEKYIKCFLANACNPNNNNACAENSGVCGVNTIGGGEAPLTAAIATYNCACP
jgi:hypothetical protein